MNTRLESYSNMPTSNTAAILYRVLRGTEPNAVGLDCGDTSRTVSPGRTPNFCAKREPTMTLLRPRKSSSVPARILSAIMSRALISPGRTPRTMAPAATLLALTSTWPSTVGITRTTPSTPAIFAAMSSKSVSGRLVSSYTPRWPLRPRMRCSSSARKPFITDMTMISVATPSAIPASENPAMTDTKPFSRRARR